MARPCIAQTPPEGPRQGPDNYTSRPLVSSNQWVEAAIGYYDKITVSVARTSFGHHLNYSLPLRFA